MCPSVKPFIDDVMSSSKKNDKSIEANCNELLWEIADLIIYSKYPEIYDANVEFPWDIDEIVPPQNLQGKAVIDAGAGPGKLSFLLAQYAKTVFAVEPVGGFRRFMKEKIKNVELVNLFVVDGVLDSLPFPDSSIDYLFTSNAIGWNIGAELCEIERVLKPNGCAIHLFKTDDNEVDAMKKLHNVLVSSEWNYQFDRFQNTTGCKMKYRKTTT
jgi:ubiquinone/menaquinone biosynthesis C-methylase UbiE